VWKEVFRRWLPAAMVLFGISLVPSIFYPNLRVIISGLFSAFPLAMVSLAAIALDVRDKEKAEKKKQTLNMS